VLAAAFGVLSLLPYEGSALAAALLFGPVRCLQWACYFQFLADERRYPPDLTGRALGYNNVVIGLVADAMPALLTFLVKLESWGGGEEGRYTTIKMVCLVFLGFSAAFPALLFREANSHAAKEARAARLDSTDGAPDETEKLSTVGI